jgi:hypothetical protein
MLPDNSRRNINRLGIWLPLIIIASKIIRWKFMLYNLVYMSIGWSMAFRIWEGDNVWGGPGAGVLRNAEWLFSKTNFLGVVSFVGWEIYFSVIYNIAFAFFIINFYKKNPHAGTKENIFIYFNLAILNIYCFAMSKESYQVLFWFLLAWCINFSTTYKKKLIALMIGLVFTFTFSRKYYALISLYFVVIQFYVTSFLSNIDTSSTRGRKKLIQSIFGLFVIFAIFHFFFMGFMESASQDQYEELVRVNTREGSHADSEITPIFKGNRVMLTLDYFVKIFRLAFPIELLIKAKPTYIITIAYQSLLLLFLYNAFKNRNKNSIEDMEEDNVDDVNSFIEDADYEENEENENEDERDSKNVAALETRDRIDTRTIALYTYLAFLLCSAMFEPDFGSWLRHQSVAFPIIIYIL